MKTSIGIDNKIHPFKT